MKQESIQSTIYQALDINNVNPELHEVIKTYLENNKYLATKQQKRQVLLKIVTNLSI